jgi:hypothetical protein
MGFNSAFKGLNCFLHPTKLKKIYACMGYRNAVIPQLVSLFVANPSTQIRYDPIDIFVVLQYREQNHTLDHTAEIRKQTAIEYS